MISICIFSSRRVYIGCRGDPRQAVERFCVKHTQKCTSLRALITVLIFDGRYNTYSLLYSARCLAGRHLRGPAGRAFRIPTPHNSCCRVTHQSAWPLSRRPLATTIAVPPGSAVPSSAAIKSLRTATAGHTVRHLTQCFHAL